MSDASCAERVPEAVVSRAKQQAAELNEKRAKLAERLVTLAGGSG